MRKNLHGKILKRESKKQHLSIVPKSYPYYKWVFIIEISLFFYYVNQNCTTSLVGWNYNTIKMHI